MTCYSAKHKLMFIHIPKTGGVSITQWMQNYGHGKLFAENHHGAKHFDIKSIHKHMKLDDIDINDTTYFTVVRNPWDRMVSTYHYYKKRDKMDVTFEDFIKGKWSHGWGCSTKQQYQYFNDKTIVLRFEELESHFQSKISDPIIKNQTRLGRHNKSQHESYETYYNKELSDIVATKCAQDIKLLNYIPPAL